MVNTIHGRFASGRDTMAARRKHIQEVDVAVVKMSDPIYLDHLVFLFTKHDAEGPHFPHDNYCKTYNSKMFCQKEKLG